MLEAAVVFDISPEFARRQLQGCHLVLPAGEQVCE